MISFDSKPIFQHRVLRDGKLTDSLINHCTDDSEIECLSDIDWLLNDFV